MATQSKRTRRRMHQSGLGSGQSVVPHIPVRLQQRLPDPPVLRAEAKVRLIGVEHANRGSVTAALTRLATV